MPVYDMWCPDCGNKRFDKYFHNVRDRHGYGCDICMARMLPMIPKRMMINMDSTCEGWDEVLETHLRGNTHRKQVMKEQGLQERDATSLGRTDRGKWV